MTKKKYSIEQIESLVKKQVRFWRYDNREDVYMNCWTVSGHAAWGFGNYKPEFKSRQEAQNEFRNHLLKHFLKEE